MNINLKRSILRIYEITRVVLVTLIAEFRHQFTRYRRGPNQKVWNIDVVYLWSDPSDLEWSQKRLGVLEKENRGSAEEKDDSDLLDDIEILT